MKRDIKIILIVAIVAIMLVLDYQMMRISRVELKVKDLLTLERRLLDLGSEVSSRSDFGNRLDRLESRMHIAYAAYAQSNLLQSQLNISDQFVGDESLFSMALNKNGIFNFRTEQSAEAIDDARIGGTPFQSRLSWGTTETIDIGKGKNEDIYRILIKFHQIRPGVLNGAKIIGAVMYLWQYDDAHDNESAAKEVAGVYALRKEWGEGDNRFGKADKGGASWIMASEGQTPWIKAGCDDPQEDYAASLLASSGSRIYGDIDGWVPFYFNKKGIEKLQEWFSGVEFAPYYGFFIKSPAENKSNTHVTFYSSEYQESEKRPYLQIFYVKDSGRQAIVQ